MNEMTNVNESDVSALINQTIDSNDLNKLKSDFIPDLRIASGLSESVNKKMAHPGEFVLDKTTSLGDIIAAVPLAYRLHCALVNSVTFDFVESSYVVMGQKPSEEYRQMIVMTPPENHEIQQGADMFFYIPQANSFAQIFLKKTLAKFAQPIWSAGEGGRLLRLATQLEQNRARTRQWYSIVITSTTDALKLSQLKDVSKTISMDIELYAKYYKQFTNPRKTVAETVAETENSNDTLER